MNLSTPTPGIVTRRSRGIESSAIASLSGSTRSRIVVSERPGSPFVSRRLSEPRMRIVCGSPPSTSLELVAQRGERVVVAEALGDVGQVDEQADRGRGRDRDHDHAARRRGSAPTARFARGALPSSSSSGWRRRPPAAGARSASARPPPASRPGPRASAPCSRRGRAAPASAASSASALSASASVSASTVSLGRSLGLVGL